MSPTKGRPVKRFPCTNEGCLNKTYGIGLCWSHFKETYEYVDATAGSWVNE